MLLNITNGTFDTCLHCMRIACNNLQGNIVTMTKSLHFGTDKFLGAIDAKVFRDSLGNCDVVG